MFRKIRVLPVALVMVLVLLMSGCNLQEKIGESITEKLIESAVGDELDVDIDGENFSYSTDEGEVTYDEDGVAFEGDDGTVMLSGGTYDWPKDQAAAYLPALGVGVVTYIINGPDSCMVIVEELEAEDYEAYVEEIIDAGYTKDTVNSSTTDMELYSGSTEDGFTVTMYFTPSEGAVQITIDASAEQ